MLSPRPPPRICVCTADSNSLREGDVESVWRVRKGCFGWERVEQGPGRGQDWQWHMSHVYHLPGPGSHTFTPVI